MADYKKQVFEMLGIEPNEEFNLYDNEKNVYFDGTYKLDECLYVRHKVENGWEYFYAQLVNIINGSCRIERIHKPTEDDIIVLKYGKMCGYEWVAKDEVGTIYFHRRKPKKEGIYWSSGESLYRVDCDISFLSWEDKEPTNIDAVLKEYEND